MLTKAASMGNGNEIMFLVHFERNRAHVCTCSSVTDFGRREHPPRTWRHLPKGGDNHNSDKDTQILHLLPLMTRPSGWNPNALK